MSPDDRDRDAAGPPRDGTEAEPAGTAPGPLGRAAADTNADDGAAGATPADEPEPEPGPRGRRRATTGRPILAGKLGEIETRIGEGIHRIEHKVGEQLHKIEDKVGESLAQLPAMPKTRKSRMLVRSVAVGFALVFSWIAAIVWWQVRKSPTPDFRPQAEAILVALRDGQAARVYTEASPRFQELVLEERFVDDMTEMRRTLGRFLEITAIDETEITKGPGGRTGRVSMRLLFEKGVTHGSIAFHWDERRWKLLGVSVEMPEDVVRLESTPQRREERVRAPPEIREQVEAVLSMIRDGKLPDVWDNAAPVFQSSVSKAGFAELEKSRRDVLGVYRRILNVTSSRQNPGQTSATLDALIEYDTAVVTGTFGFTRVGDLWKLSSYKLVLPKPRVPPP